MPLFPWKSSTSFSTGIYAGVRNNVALIYNKNNSWPNALISDRPLILRNEKLLRKLLNICYPNTVSTKSSSKIQTKKTGAYLLQNKGCGGLDTSYGLPENSPAKQATTEFERTIKLPKGRRPTTWIGNIKQQLKSVEIGMASRHPTL